MRKIIAQQRIIARDQNKVFVVKADRRKLSPSDAEETYGLDPGRANAYVEFDMEPAPLLVQYNRQLQTDELFIVGDVDLTDRHAEAFFNF